MDAFILSGKSVKRPLALCVFGFMTVLSVLCFFMENSSLYFALASFAIALVFFFLRFHVPYARHIFLLLLGIFAASAVWFINLNFVYKPMISLSGQGGELIGWVRDYPQVYDDYTRLELKVESFGPNRPRRMKVRVYLDGEYGSLEPGDYIRLFTELELPQNSWNFASRRYLNSHGIFFTASADEAELIEGRRVPIYARLRRIAKLSEASINRIMPEQEAGMMTALILGDESALPDGFSRELQTSGLSHITAVSGMNVAFLYAVLITLFGRRAGSIIGIPAVIIFVLITGCSASVVRAGIMHILLIIAYFISREADSLTDLTISALIILLVNPFAIADIGFLLSFFATLGIVICSAPTESFIRKHIVIKHKFINRLVCGTLQVIVQTLSAQLFILPIQALCFGELSLVAPFSNVSVLWATEYAFTFGVFAAIAGSVWLPLGMILGFIPRLLCAYILKAVPFFASIPYASICADSIYIYALIVLLYVIWVILKLTGYREKGFAFSVFIFTCVTAFALSVTQKNMTASVAVISTVTGQSTVIRNGSDFVVFNAGGSGSYAVSGLDDYLWEEGCREIDILAISSYRKADIGNAGVLLEKYKVKELLLPVPRNDDDVEICNSLLASAEEYGVSVKAVKDSTRFLVGDMDIIMHVNKSNDSDNGRMLMKASVGIKNVISLGAIQPENLGRMLYEVGYPHADILALGDYYSQKFIPGSVKALHPDSVVLSSFNKSDSSLIFDLASIGSQSYVTERKGRFVISFPFIDYKS